VLAAGGLFATPSEPVSLCACVKKDDPHSGKQTSKYTEVVWVPKVVAGVGLPLKQWS
jgi:hypothetical protein